MEDKLADLATEVAESRRENGVIIGCLYMVAAAINDPKIKEVIDGMLARNGKIK
jgi:hypothetical protein